MSEILSLLSSLDASILIISLTFIDTFSIFSIPIIDSTTSFCPLPSTPAIPSISDSKTLKETSEKNFLPSTDSEVILFISSILFLLGTMIYLE